VRLDNLLRNAVEASPEGARVDVKLARRGDLLSIRVEDHGAGVPKDRITELFEPFFTTKPEGTVSASRYAGQSRAHTEATSPMHVKNRRPCSS